MMLNKTYKIRNAKPDEFAQLGNLMVQVYSQLDGFQKPHEQPYYYTMLTNIGGFTSKPGAELLVAVDDADTLAVWYILISNHNWNLSLRRLYSKWFAS